MRRLWARVRQSHVPDGAWVDYHENSKTTRHIFTAPRGDAEVKAWMNALERRPFVGHDILTLDEPGRLDTSLGDLLRIRRSSRDLTHVPLTKKALSTLLHATYGITAALDEKLELRTVPSAGAMFPLEIFVALGSGHELGAGLYVWLPHVPGLHPVRGRDSLAEVADCTIEPELVRSATAVILIGAVFERTVYKYGERGYRFVLLEAGHAAQNLALACAALNLRALPYGGIVDREIDELLGFDGVSMSCIYAVVIGG